MPYSSQDKYEMSLRQAKVDIGAGRGNAMSNAVNLLTTQKIHFETETEMIDWLCKTADIIFYYNQRKIDEDYKQWLHDNDSQLRLDTGVDVPTINAGETVQFPTK